MLLLRFRLCRARYLTAGCLNAALRGLGAAFRQKPAISDAGPALKIELKRLGGLVLDESRPRAKLLIQGGERRPPATAAPAEGHAPMVNSDVVSHDWDGMKQRLREVAVDVERGWKRITG
jgi:hypothetical protein